MVKHKINTELSRSVYKKNKNAIHPKDCYRNIFRLLPSYQAKFAKGEWKIAYGYVSSMPGIFCRHCFILCDSGVIDPTVYSVEKYVSKDNDSREYYITKVFSDIKTYIDAVIANDLYPGLSGYLFKEDVEAVMWAHKHNLVFVG